MATIVTYFFCNCYEIQHYQLHLFCPSAWF